MQKNAQQYIIDIIEAYSKQEVSLEETLARIKTMVDVDREVQTSPMDQKSSMFSPIGFAVRSAAEFNCPEIIIAIEKTLDKKEQREDRIRTLEDFCHHISNKMCENTTTLNTVFAAFNDVINAPFATGRTAIYGGIHLEVQGKEGVLAAMLNNGADPQQDITVISLVNGLGTTETPLEFAKNNVARLISKIEQKMADNDKQGEAFMKGQCEKWQNIVDMFNHIETNPVAPLASSRTRKHHHRTGTPDHSAGYARS